MRAVLCLLVVAACADQDPIGATEWIAPLAPAMVRVSTSGRIAEGTMDTVATRDADGTALWSVMKLYNDALDIDATGNVYVARAEGAAGRKLYKLAAADGATVWSLALGSSSTGAIVVVGRDDVIWYFTGVNTQMQWARYSSAGALLATGMLAASIRDPIALDDGRLLVAGNGRLLTLDAGGVTSPIGIDDVYGFVRHEDGEITASTGTGLVRYGTDGAVRWRRGADTSPSLRAVADRLLVGSQNDVGSQLALVDRDGDTIAEEWFTVNVSLVREGQGDQYLFTFFGSDVIDLHDRVVPYDGDGSFAVTGLAARRLR